jgi:xanthine dehydrogenase accessory factor
MNADEREQEVRYAAAARRREQLHAERLAFDIVLAAERFPEAQRVLSDARVFARTVVSSPSLWVLVTTHEHALDQDLVEVLLPLDLAWIGLIGSRTKVTRFAIRLRAAGMDPAQLAHLRSPVGLDIGAETPEEIAVSIAAEWVQRRRQPVS